MAVESRPDTHNAEVPTHNNLPITESVGAMERPCDLVPIATMARSQLTTLDPLVEERLTLETFEVFLALENAVLRKLSSATQDKFDLREFIGAVSENLITQSQEDPGRKYHFSY